MYRSAPPLAACWVLSLIDRPPPSILPATILLIVTKRTNSLCHIVTIDRRANRRQPSRRDTVRIYSAPPSISDRIDLESERRGVALQGPKCSRGIVKVKNDLAGQK